MIIPSRNPVASVDQPSLIGAELPSLLTEWGVPAYRVAQIRRWLYQELVFDPAPMTDLPRSLRERLARETKPFPLTLTAERSADHGLTTKALLQLADGAAVEAVLMRYPETAQGRARRTICVSSQVGCAVGCPFCATGLLGLKRQLAAPEIAGQVLYFARKLRHEAGSTDHLTNVVFMGEGEPLANYRNVWPAVEVLTDPEGLGIGARRITISTSGLAPRIRDLARELRQVGLAVSLHAPTDDLRDQLVPVNRKYRIAEVLDACREYVEATHRRVSFEYAMMRDVNDSREQAITLAKLLQGMLAHVNLIPLNLVEGSPFLPTPWTTIVGFQRLLLSRGISCTIRATRGDDIEGACGQLKASLAGDDARRLA